MAKRLSTTNLNAADIKALASIPTQANMTVGTGYVDCTNISLSGVKNAIGGSDYSLYDLCRTNATFTAGGQSGKVNAWSRYKPGTVSYASGQTPTNIWDAAPTFTYTKPNIAHLGDFAGYNHVENTRPVYGTFGTPSYNLYKGINGLNTVNIYSPFTNGYMVPVLSSGKEDESYWNRVKIHWTLKTSGGNSGLQKFPITSGQYLTLNNPQLMYSVSTGLTPDTYTLWAQPWYYNSSNQPVAQCECGATSTVIVVNPVTQFLADYYFIGWTETTLTNFHDFGSGSVESIYFMTNDIKILNNGYGYSPYWNNTFELQFQLRMQGTSGNTGSVSFGIGTTGHIGDMVIPYNPPGSYISWPNYNYYNVDIGDSLPGITQGDLYLQVSDDFGATYVDWVKLGTYGNGSSWT